MPDLGAGLKLTGFVYAVSVLNQEAFGGQRRGVGLRPVRDGGRTWNNSKCRDGTRIRCFLCPPRSYVIVRGEVVEAVLEKRCFLGPPTLNAQRSTLNAHSLNWGVGRTRRHG